MSSMSWDPVTGRMRVDPDPRTGDRRPRWSDIEARIAYGEQLPPQSEWVGGAPWETLFGESGSMPDIPIGGPWGGTTAPVFPPGPIGTNQTEPIVLTEPGTVGPAGTTIDPVQDAVDQATGGNLAQEIMAYLGGDQAGVYREDYDIDGDGEISIRDSIYQMQTEGGLRNPDGTPVAQPDPVQDAVDAAVGGGTKPSPSSYGAVDNWGEPGFTTYDSTNQLIDPIGSVAEEPVSPFMDEDPLTDTWTAPVVDILPTAGAGAGGDPRTDFAPVNNLFEPTTGDPYSVGVINPNATDPVTGVDPNAPGPDPTHYDYDTGTYNPPDTTGAVDDMTIATAGFPANPAEGQQFTDATGQTWISIQGQWVKIGDIPLPGDTTVTTDPTVTDPTVTDPTVTDPTVTDPTVTDPTVTDPTGTGQSEIDRLNALIAEMQAKQEAERAAWEAQTAAATQKYTLTGPSIGYNPYVSGQYQSDPYGAAGVPDLGGITTIPVPDAWQPPTLQPWQAPTQTSNTWGQ